MKYKRMKIKGSLSREKIKTDDDQFTRDVVFYKNDRGFISVFKAEESGDIWLGFGDPSEVARQIILNTEEAIVLYSLLDGMLFDEEESEG